MKQIFKAIFVLLSLWLAFELAARLIIESLWFEEVGYLTTFLKRLLWQLGLWGVTTGLSACFLVGNLRLAQRLKWQFVPETRIKAEGGTHYRLSLNNPKPKIDSPQSLGLRLSWLLPMVLGFNLLLGVMLLYYSEVAIAAWMPDFDLSNVTLPWPSPFKIGSAWQIMPQMNQIWQWGGVLVVVILLFLNAQFGLGAIAWGISFVFGSILSGNWATVLPYFQPTAFAQTDPQFGKNISFYIFKLPVWQLLDFWLGGLFLSGLIVVSLTYLLSGDSLSQGKFLGLSRPQLRHLYALGGAMAGAIAWRHWLNGYELLYSARGIIYGAGYTDVQVQLPVEKSLGILAGGIAFWLFWKAIAGSETKIGVLSLARPKAKKIPLFLSLLSIYLITIIAGILCIAIVQRLVVQPNEVARERPYIERSLAFTRAAFKLNNMEVKTFAPEGQLTAANIQKNDLTIDNIRLWDTRPLLQTNRQLQQIRLYYKFPDADIDRYEMKVEFNRTEDRRRDGEVANLQRNDQQPISKKQQVIIAARELDYSAVPEQAKTWVNEHLVYTHGYGFTLSPVNSVDEGGLPYYFVKDIGNNAEEGALRTSSEIIRASIPIGKPRIYYGELTNTYVMTSTRVKELDYPSGQENIYNTYDGTGGISIKSFWQRLLFAEYLKDWQMLFTRNFTPETRLLFRRNINLRIRQIAPFLRFDRDPYLVVADAGDATQGRSPNYLHWIVDAYTTSDRYPYSDPGNQKFNYIRNSVKIVIDAYNGDVDFYIADPNDPIIQTWTKIFPGLFHSLEQMPPLLRRHIRYPEDLYTTQSERLLTYHMTDPQVFYNREDQWQIPQEIYGTQVQPVEAYYLIMKLPTATSEEFILLLPYTPKGRNNLIATTFGRSDGQEYGKLLLYQLPKQRLIYGPEQIEARINQDPVISQQISLWNREGSHALQGNLLVIPIQQSLLYVEPVYLEATENSLPTLVRVIVVYENRIVMAPTLKEALQAIFEPHKSSRSTIVRELK